MTAVAQCLPQCFSGLNLLISGKQDAAMQEVAHSISQDAQAGVGKLLQEALDNGTLEKALATPAQIRPPPLPSCPHLSAKSFQTQVKTLLEDALVIGTLSLDQAKELRDLIASYNNAKRSESERRPEDLVRNMLANSVQDGTLAAVLAEEQRARASANPVEVFPVVHQVFSKEEMEANVGKLLQDALDDGTLEAALSTPAEIRPAPLPSCPNMSLSTIKGWIKNLLEDGVAGGKLSLDQAKELRDLIATYNHLQSKMQAEQDALVIIDFSKLFQYTPPERRVNVSDNQPSVSAASWPGKSSKLDMEDMSAAEIEARLQAQERAADME